MAYGAACSGRGASIGLLFAALARAVEQQVRASKAQQLANTAWAFATVKQSYEKPLTNLARAAERRLSSFNDPEEAKVTLAFANMA